MQHCISFAIEIRVAVSCITKITPQDFHHPSPTNQQQHFIVKHESLISQYSLTQIWK